MKQSKQLKDAIKRIKAAVKEAIINKYRSGYCDMIKCIKKDDDSMDIFCYTGDYKNKDLRGFYILRVVNGYIHVGYSSWGVKVKDVIEVLNEVLEYIEHCYETYDFGGSIDDNVEIHHIDTRSKVIEKPTDISVFMESIETFI